MYLEKLEIQGFKSFASKTALTFEPPKGKRRIITAIVGPNGSGKSNVADALRWALGEQSMKLLRSKKSEDVLWHGSDKRPRAGFAEISLYLNNQDREADIEYAEVVITRRLYRDGESEYLINKNKVRLSDVQLLLAKANFGERHYAIIGQGMIDSILLLSPEERRDFFDEATGVKPYQIKKEQAINKLKITEDNLRQAEGLLAELEPRMRSLSRSVKRLEDREIVEVELHGLQHHYYGNLWHKLRLEINAEDDQLKTLEENLSKKNQELQKTKQAMTELEKKEARGEAFLKLQRQFQKIIDERGRLRDQEFKIKTEIERAKYKSAAPIPLPISKIIAEIKSISENIDLLWSKVEKAKNLEEVRAIFKETESFRENLRALLDHLERPAPEDHETKINQKLETELAETKKSFERIEAEMRRTQNELETVSKDESQKKSAFFEAQRTLQARSDEAHTIESQVNALKIELTRLLTRREALEGEMTRELKERAERIKAEIPEVSAALSEETSAKIQKLKYQLELIGGIDPETIKEFKETSERHQFLSSEIKDLRESLTSLGEVIKELDTLIDKQFTANFNRISDNFSRYFKTLFNGGSAKLMKTLVKASEESETETGEEAETESPSPSLAQKYEEEKYVIDISATPPAKRIRGLAQLSGGEKALTAIALIMAIISNQPSPFVVLDEVDAALDENNAIRFAGILEELGEKTQFIIVTHNRYTMEKAETLYGVTMGDNGVSQLLSVKLEEAIRR